MAKKKTKTKASLLVAAAVASVKDTAVEHEKVNGQNISNNVNVNNNIDASNNHENIVVEMLTARLKSTVGKSVSLHKQARAIITSSDALHLNLSVGEYVILLSLDEHDTKSERIENVHHKPPIKALVVLPIEIHNDKQSSTSTNSRNDTSPMILRKNISYQQWSPGIVQITSSSLLESFASSSIDKRMTDRSMEEITKSTPTTTTTSNTATPVSQPTTTKFSFRSLVSSPTPSSTGKIRTPGSSTKKNSYRNDISITAPRIKVIPCRTTIGKLIIQSRTSTCSKLVVVYIESQQMNDHNDDDKPLLDSSSSMKYIFKSSISTLTRLIQAHILESFVMIGQQFRISFTGKSLHFKIIDASTTILDENDDDLCSSRDSNPNVSRTATKNSTKEYRLEEEFSRLHLQNDDSTNDHDEETKELYSAILDSNIQLYRVLRSTQIIVSNEELDKISIGMDIHETETDNEMMGRPLKSAQYVAGLSTTIDELRSLLFTPLSRPELFTSRGMKIPKGVLLHGPNGVGKTGMAKQFLVEVETTLKCPTQYIHCASLQSKSDLVGEAESALSKLFRPTARGSTPSLLVLDDIHLICSKRGNAGSSQGLDRLAATLLALMDGIEGNNSTSSSMPLPSGNVVVLAITTNPSVLDPALRRPGRLDAEVEVPLPEDACNRAEIIQFHLSNFGIELADDLQKKCDFLDVAKAAKGFNGADCMLAVKEAIRLAIFETINTPKTLLRKHHLITAMRSIKPSAIKSISVEIPQVLWSSIGGMDSVKRDLREAIELPLTHSHYFEQLRVPPPRGILLYGPPGCSKTLMARAMATEGNMNFLAVKGPELLSKWLGESERALSSLFRRARMASPAIVFFDEVDAIASKRGSGDSASSGRLLSQLLTELDGVNHPGRSNIGSHPTNKTKSLQRRVVIVGATNRPDLLDTALTRPGRIDRMIYVGPPDVESRGQILQITLQKSCCNWDDIDLSKLASDEVSGGFSGAEMVAICRDAALLALEESDDNNHQDNIGKQPVIEMRHLLMAINSMQRQITPSMIDFYKSYQESYKRNNG